MSPNTSSAMPAIQSSSLKQKGTKRKRASEHDSGHKTFIPAERSDSGGFQWRKFEMDIPLAPVHSGDLRAGIHQVLERWLTRYIPSLGFVLLAIDYDTLHCPTTARILPPTAMALVQGVQFSALGWRPTVGTKLKGRIMHSTRSNISLIVHNTFNAVIDAKHLPMDTYTWDSERVNPVPPYEPLTDDFFKDMFKQEEDEEAATNANGIQEGLSELALQQKQQEETQEQESTIGCWVLQQNQQPVGDGQGMLEFTVVGLTIANSTVTVMGSLSERPFEATQATASAFNSTTRVSPEAAHQIDLDGDEERAEIAEQETRPSEKEKKKKKKRKDKP